MESYRLLSQVDGMSSLVAFCLDPLLGEVHAAFEYNHHSVSEAIHVPSTPYSRACLPRNGTNFTSSSLNNC